MAVSGYDASAMRLRLRIAAGAAEALREFFAGQAARAVLRLVPVRAMKAVMPSDRELLPSDEDNLLALIIQPFLERGIIGAATLAAMMVDEAPPTLQEQRVLDQLRRAGQRVARVNDATRDALRKVLQQAQMDGYSTYQTAVGVPADGFRGVRAVVEELYKGRALAIARTEIGEAALEASRQEWERSRVRYLDIIDGDVDEPCASRNGTRVSIAMAPSLAHPNCTLVTMPVLEGRF